MEWNCENCKCRKLVDKLIDECAETIEEVKLANTTIFENENKYGSCERSSCRVFIVLMIVVYFIILFLWYYLFCLLQLVFD